MATLIPGDRIADFERPDRQGEPRTLYKQDFARPLVLAYARTSQAAGVLFNFLMRPAALWDRVERLMLVHEAGIGALADDARFLVLRDDGPLLEHLAGGSAGPSAAVFALDANFRIIERIDVADDGRDLLRRLEHVYDAVLTEPARLLQQPAPVLMIPRVFEPLLCRQLIKEFDADGGEQSGVSYVENGKTVWKSDPAVKQRRDYYPKDPAVLEEIKALIGRRVLPEIHKAFQYKVTRHEPFKMVCYEADPGGYFRPHRDNDSRPYAHRRFAMTINLNTGDYTGGALRFPEYGPHEYLAEQGGAIVFSCSLLHEACDVTSGRRYALLGFFFGEDNSGTC